MSTISGNGSTELQKIIWQALLNLMVVVSELSFFKKLALGYYLIKNKADHFKHARHLQTAKMRIELPEHIFNDIQIDGEYHNLKTNILEITLLQIGLKVLAGTNLKSYSQKG